MTEPSLEMPQLSLNMYSFGLTSPHEALNQDRRVIERGIEGASKLANFIIATTTKPMERHDDRAEFKKLLKEGDIISTVYVSEPGMPVSQLSASQIGRLGINGKALTLSYEKRHTGGFTSHGMTFGRSNNSWVLTELSSAAYGLQTVESHDQPPNFDTLYAADAQLVTIARAFGDAVETMSDPNLQRTVSVVRHF